MIADIGALPGNESTRPPSPGFVPAVRPAAKLRQRVLDVFAGAQRDAAAGAHALREVSQQVGAALISAAIELPETTSRWARLAAAAFAADKLAPRIEEAYAEEKTDPAIFREMGEAGLLGITVPEEYGGLGAGYVTYGLVAREVERVDSGYRSMMSVPPDAANAASAVIAAAVLPSSVVT